MCYKYIWWNWAKCWMTRMYSTIQRDFWRKLRLLAVLFFSCFVHLNMRVNHDMLHEFIKARNLHFYFGNLRLSYLVIFDLLSYSPYHYIMELFNIIFRKSKHQYDNSYITHFYKKKRRKKVKETETHNETTTPRLITTGE